MQDLSQQYAAPLAPSSMSSGNTLSANEDAAMGPPGSQSINPIPDRVDLVPQPTVGRQRDLAHLIGQSGAPDRRPGSDGGWVAAGGYDQ